MKWHKTYLKSPRKNKLVLVRLEKGHVVTAKRKKDHWVFYGFKGWHEVYIDFPSYEWRDIE